MSYASTTIAFSNQGAEVFLCNPENKYIGRVCPWKDCRPFIRQSCDALNCGAREYLHDDLETISLPDELMCEPPLELWPSHVERTTVPDDVRSELLDALQQMPVNGPQRLAD